MPDNKRKRGKADRSKVARLQAYEIDYVARLFRVSTDRVKALIKRIGNDRWQIYRHFRKRLWRKNFLKSRG